MSTEFFSNVANFDLLSVGIAVAGMAVLGFAVFFNTTKSASNRIFLALALATSAWGSLNYFSYQPNDPATSFWFLRWAVFFAVISAFFTFSFAYVFPLATKTLSWWFKRVIMPLSALTAIATLTPFVFRSVAKSAPDGHVTEVEVGWGLFLFVFTVLVLNIGAVILFIKKLVDAEPEQKAAFRTILIGMLVMLALVIVFNLILPALFQNTRFVPLGAVFLFPFIATTAYAILKHKLFNIKVAGAAILVFALSVVSFADVIFATSGAHLVFRTGIFILVLAFGVYLIHAILKEVRQREQIEVLARELKSANERLKELDKLKSQFLSIASHDLRAPLTVVRNFLSLLLDGTYGKLPAAAEEGMRQVFERATDMAKSVDNYLNVSRIEQGRMKYDFIEVELLPVIEKAIKDFAPNAEKKGLSMRFTASPELKGRKAKLDIAKINEVLNNLLDNAIKYTPKGSITAVFEPAGNGARLTIQDTGVGMSQKTIRKLFKLFSTGSESLKVNTSSTGVGLYITKAHVEAHQGRVWAESEGEGKGSRFVLELPLVR